MIKLCECVSFPGKESNEDYFAHNDSCAVILDGATGLVPSALEVRDFVRELAFEMLEKTDCGYPVWEAVNQALATLRDRHEDVLSELCGGILPSAAMIAVSETEEHAEVVLLGDCTAVLFLKNGTEVLHRTDLDVLDNNVKERAVKISAERKITVREAMRLPEIRELLISNRRLMNAEGGYETVAFNMRPRTEADVVRFPKAEIEKIVLFSDGFDALADILTRPETENLESLYARLRREEDEDPDFEKQPRFKHGDDATAAIIKFV